MASERGTTVRRDCRCRHDSAIVGQRDVANMAAAQARAQARDE